MFSFFKKECLKDAKSNKEDHARDCTFKRQRLKTTTGAYLGYLFIFSTIKTVTKL